MRDAALAFARDVADAVLLGDPLVEMGARAADGQEEIANLRPIFVSKVATYIGCDIQSGPGVDRIEDIHHLSFEEESVGTILCFETLEHVADPIRAVQEMHRVLKPGGALAISSVMFFPIHEHPWDFWRFTPEGFEKLLEPFQTRLVVGHGYSLLPEGVYGIGIKGPDPGLSLGDFPRLKNIIEHWPGGRVVDFGPIRLTTRELWKYTLHYSRLAAKRRISTALGRSPN